VELIRFDLLAQGSAHFLLIAEFAVVDDRVGRAEESGFLRCVCVGVDRRGGGDDADQVTGWQYVRAPETYSQFSRADFHLDTDSYLSAVQSVCIIGYTLFPLVIAAMLSALRLPAIARVPVYLVLIAWSLAAGVSILGGSGVVKNRVGIAVYPLFVFYVGLGCLCFIS